jgi:hypothetical protein
MVTALIIGGVVVYVVGSYVWMAHTLSDKGMGAGPGGLGWLAFPAAPIIVPMVGWQLFKGFMRWVFK